MTSTSTAPDWLVPGAEVVVYSTGGAGTPVNPVRTTVKRVAGQSFTVDDAVSSEPRFRIKTLDAECGRGWSSWRRRVVPIDSDVARAVLDKERVRRLTARADQAYDQWRRDRSSGNLRELIGRLRLIEDEG